MIRSGVLVIIGFFISGVVKAQQLSSVSAIKTKVDSVRKYFYTGPSSDLLPAELNAHALENEYYCDTTHPKRMKGHISVLTLRDNNSFIYETFYTPYNWARIQYYVGEYRISGDTIRLDYKALLEGKTGVVYVSPILPVSWIPPRPPDHLLLGKGHFFDPYAERPFYPLPGKPQFILQAVPGL